MNEKLFKDTCKKIRQRIIKSLYRECNSVWFSNDNELTEEALKISNEINCYIPGSSQDYWDQIDIRLYKHHKDKLMKYYSNGQLE